MAVDSFKAIIDKLRVTGVPAGDRLPANFDKAPLPRIQVQPLAPGQRVPALNTLGMDRVTYDVDVYVSPAMYNSGEAWALARKLRAHLATLRTPDGVRALNVGVPEKRPAFNDSIYRLGFTLEVALPA